MRFGRRGDGVHRVAKRGEREAATSINLCTNQRVSQVLRRVDGVEVMIESWVICVATFDSRTVIDADDDALLVHEDSYVGVRRNVPSFQGIADLGDAPKAVRRAAINLSGNEGIGRRRGLGPAGSAPLERGGRDGARRRRRH